jgi:outer membrane protein TolC
VLAIAGQIAASRALLAPLALKADQAGHLLASLEGALPATATLPEIELSGLALPGDLPVSLPADLVRQRPDILAASLGNVSAGSGTFWSIGPSVSVPIFQGGRLWYGRKAAIDAFHGAEDGYRQTVLTAFEQVADALKALEHDAEALQASSEVSRSAADALMLLQANERAGLVANLDVLGADVQLHQATLGYLQAVAQRHQDTVALFAALGGGWWNDRHAADRGRAP